MDFNVNDWLGDWISFEHLINNHDPNLDRAWKDSTKAMRSKPLFAIMMLGDARRFWAKACKTSGKEWRFRIGGWHIEQPSAVGDDDAVAGFNLTWLDEKRTPITTHEYRLDHVHDKGLEGKPCLCSTLAMPVPPIPSPYSSRWSPCLNAPCSDTGDCSVICIFNMPLMKANSSKVLANKPRSAIACGIPPCAPLKGRYLINATSYVRCIIFKHGGNCLSHHQTDCRCPKMGQYQHCDDCRYRPVTLSGHAAIREGAPSHTTRPPASPPPGPISTT